MHQTPGPIAFASFGSVSMLLWATAALIPVLIHLWNRRKHAETSWAAMEYLLAAIRNNARRMRIEQLILLAVRVLTLVLLAAALADPVVSSIWGLGPSLLGSRRTHTVLVLDGSYSMDFRDADLTRFETAQRMASDCVRQGRHGDGFSLVLMGQPTQIIIETPVFDRNHVAAEIQSLKTAHAGADLYGTLESLDAIINAARAELPELQRTEIHIFTDLGRTTWQEASEERCQQRIQALGQRASITVADVGQPDAENVAITALNQRVAVATTGPAIQLHVSVRNFGQHNVSARSVDLYVNGRQIEQRLVDVAPGADATVEFGHVFEAGEHAVEARLGEDPLKVDNIRYRSIPVGDALRVLCIRGRYGAARNVALALAPDNSEVSRVRVQVVSDNELLQTDLHQFDCVFLCNVGRFESEEAAALRRYLQTGGGLVFLLGDQVQADNYNLQLGARAGQGRVLPARIGNVVDEARYLFDPRDYSHRIVSLFRGHESAGLLTTPVWKYMQLEPYVASNVRVALWFDSGNPAIVEGPSLGGRSIVVATSAADMSVDPLPWNALATWPSFPPLVHELLAAAMAQRHQDRNLQVGDPIASSMREPTSEPSLTIVHAGHEQRVRMTVDGTETRWTYPETRTNGIYRAVFQPPTIAPQLFALNVDTCESDLRRVDPAQLPSSIRLANAGDLPTARTSGIGNTGWPLFRLLLGTVLLLLLTETFLAWHFGRARA